MCDVQRSMDRPEDLPEFDRPPVEEVAIGGFRRPIDPFKDTLAVQFLQSLAPLGFTTFDIRGPLMLDDDAPSEPLNTHRPQRFEVLQEQPPNRFWFTATD